MPGAARDGPAGQSVGQQLHILMPAAADQPAELLRCERKTWIIIDRAPHPRAEEPPNQASQPPHVNSLAPATNLSVRILFLPHLRDCKRPMTTPHQKKSAENNLLRRANRQNRRRVQTPDCARGPSALRSRRSHRRDSPSQRRVMMTSSCGILAPMSTRTCQCLGVHRRRCALGALDDRHDHRARPTRA